MQRRTQQYVYRLFPLLFLFLFTACGDLEGSAITQPDDASDAAPTGTFGVSEAFGGPYLSDADGAITDASDARVVSVAPGGSFFVQVDYEDPSGITNIDVNLVNSSPEGLAGTLDPTQSFFTLGQPTGISEPSGCDLSGSPTSVTCIYEVQVAEDAVNISELDGSGDEFAYVFRTQVTGAEGNTSDKAERGYVVITGDEGEPQECVNPVNIPDEGLEEAFRFSLDKFTGTLTCEDLAEVTSIRYGATGERGRRIENLEGLQFAVNVRELRLTNLGVTDYTPIASLDKLKILNIVNAEVDDLDFLAELTQLTDINLSRNDISDLGPLANLTNLKVLILSGNDITDIGAVTGLSQLVVLSLLANDVTDITPLLDNPGLGEGDRVNLLRNPLDICPDTETTEVIDTLIERGVNVQFEPSENCDGNGGGGDDGQTCTNPVEIPDAALEAAVREELGEPSGALTCADLADLTALSVFYDPARDEKIQSLEGLQFAVNLRRASFNQNAISDLSPLQNLPELADLEVSSNKIESVAQLNTFESLRRLFLVNNQIDDLSGFGEVFPNLEILLLRDNPVEDLAPLRTLTDLTLLQVSGDFSDLSPIENLTNLTSFGVQDSNVADLSPLADLEDLEDLVLVNNQISDLSPLSGLTKLVFLNLENNNVADLAPLADLARLESLNLTDNEVSDLTPLADLTDLVFLYLSQNNISDLAPLTGLTELQNLYLDDNQIDDFAPLIENEGLTGDDIVKLEGNLVETCPGTAGARTIEVLEARISNLSYDPPVDCETQSACTDPVSIPDEVLRTTIRQFLELGADADITCDDLTNLTSITNDVDRDDPDPIITDLEGLQYAVNLRELLIPENGVSDLSPLRDLPILARLNVAFNGVSSLEPLAGLTSLRSLRTGNVADLSPLSDLTKLLSLTTSTSDPSPENLAALSSLTSLQDLELSNSGVSDLSFVRPLANLEDVDFTGNSVADLSPLTGLTNLCNVRLDDNDIRDIGALVETSDNGGFRQDLGCGGPTIELRKNPLDLAPGSQVQEDIETLRSRGVTVFTRIRQ